MFLQQCFLVILRLIVLFVNGRLHARKPYIKVYQDSLTKIPDLLNLVERFHGVGQVV